jgi:hypothetical protein
MPLLHEDEAGRPRPQTLGLDTDASFWYPLLPIFTNGYWRRMWIQQEVLTARRLELHCTNVTIPGLSIVYFQETLRRLFSGDVYPEGQHTYRTTTAIVHLWLSQSLVGPCLFSSYILKRRRGALVRLPRLCIDMRASKISDRIYAIMHLAEDYEEGDITVDYTKSPVHVMMDTAAHHVDRHRDLEFLIDRALVSKLGMDNRLARETTAAPTWIPRFWFGYRDGRMNLSFVPQESCNHRCSPHSVDKQNLRLDVRGVKIDNVRQRLEPDCAYDSTVSDFWSAPFGTYLQSHVSTDSTDIPPDLCDIMALVSEASSSHDDIASALSIFFRLFPDNNGAERRLGSCAFDLLDEMGQMSTAARTALVHIMTTLRGRTVVLTEWGSHRLVPACDIMEGDEIWTLFGCGSTVVLRRHPDDTYWHVCTGHFPSIQDHRDMQLLVTESMPGDKIGDWTVEDIKIA